MFAFLKKAVRETDKLLILICLTLSAIGFIAVSSATHASVDDGEFFSREAKVMIIAVALGLFFALVISFFDYDFILRIWPIIGIVSIGLMLILFPFGCAPAGRDDSICWLKITNSLYFQPSEVVKIGFVISFAAHCNKVKNEIKSFKNVLLLGVHAGIFILLVVLTGDMGSALIFVMMFIAMMFAAGVDKIYFILGPIVVAAILPVAWYKVFGTIQRNRILALIYPELYPNEIYQQNQAAKAMQNGGLFGTGLFKGVYHKMVPESQNDMVFSVICEEFGYIGAIALMVLFVILIVKIIMIGKKSGSYPARIMCTGIAYMLGSQIMVNIGMCTKLLPVIGITLPFISAGGSSSLCIYLAIGLILSIARYSKEQPAEDFTYNKLSFRGIRT
ncbi:MAG: FtsW/RodA/SpoVE family cell cycle protein [Acutalibacteraceae bacterium]|nr:FtsW/RodA/SpoVE family cell cycle protein [Oscillospiraceae bacterium]